MGSVLITGASGFFGRSVIQALKKNHAYHRYVCLYHSQKPEPLNDSRFIWRHCDLLNLSQHKKVMAEFKPTHCLHLAWHFPPQKFWHAEENLQWIMASLHLFRAFCEENGKVFLGAGSITEYDWFSGRLEEGTTPLNPQSLYSQSKKSLYELLMVIRNTSYPNCILIWPRIAYFFGLSEPSQKLMSHIIGNLYRGEPLNIVSRDSKRPYAHVKYLGEILAYVLLHQERDIVFNLGASKSYSVGDIIDYVSKCFGLKPDQVLYNSYNAPVNEPLNLDINTTLLKEKISREIPDTFFDDLKEMVEQKKLNEQDTQH